MNVQPPYWVVHDRRALRDRRDRERRREVKRVSFERRAVERRHHGERRESAGGHLRNAMQLLQEVWRAAPLDAMTRGHLEAVLERLWLALAEGERAASGARLIRRRRGRRDSQTP